ncbi:Cytochrome P450 monooxygenase [Pseudocercospora fuligena]|uniref:Cytochrome P450 monooxygenase n=1 Tax=Pseudocercospora fuligena TaxID=685502 RepID=A0A8H6RA33_9PEZI|nr:Cytochrome P450 monooxygenase [Pseudocercospora fuligena]
MASVIQSPAEHLLYAASNATEAVKNVAMEGALDSTTSVFAQPKFILIFLLVITVVAARVMGQKQKLPAGVKPLPRKGPGLPWAGRFWDVPGPGIEAAWHFGELHKKYGPIYEWQVMGTIHIWIETDKIAKDLFVTRQRNYCDRNELPAAIGVREGSEILPLMAYGEQFRRYKNFMHLIMRHANPRTFYGWPADENKRTLRRMLESPDHWSEHMLVHCARTIAGVAWADPRHGSKLLTIIPIILKAVSPAGPLINKLTFLSNLPESISPWKAQEQIRKKQMSDAFMEALQDAQQKSQEGRLEGSWSKLWLENEKGTEHLDFYEAAHAIGSSSFVAIATVGGPLHAFFTAMCHYPSWQAHVVEELDRVCGNNPPEMKDMPNLPRLRATVKEIVRWRQATPLGVPHVVMEDDVYEGYHIPKGAICHANHYLISREESTYPQGNEFKPQRFLDPKYPTYKEPLTEFPNLNGDRAFGYGNRSCPGVDLTQNELLTLIGSLIWAFEIKRCEGGNAPAVPWYETAPWVITMSKPFKCDIKVRSEAKRQYILNETPEGGNLIIDDEKQRTDKWQVVRPPGQDLFAWDGLTDQASGTWKNYPLGV